MSRDNLPYSKWSTEELANRVVTLEEQLRELSGSSKHSQRESRIGQSRDRIQARNVDPLKYSTRFIALKLAYLGRNYNGFEFAANNKTPLPTIEEMLWRALMKARLILPNHKVGADTDSVNWDGCDYTKCGRTDKGVSAFGQVISIRVRSNRPLARKTSSAGGMSSIEEIVEVENGSSPLDDNANNDLPSPKFDGHFGPALDFHNIWDEIQYPQVLNRLLPPDIRVLAWCPAPPVNFSARFSCRERQYRYFFTQPAFNPTFGREGMERSLTVDKESQQKRREGWLDIDAMREAAVKFEGLHDFRNLSKIDASRQLSDFKRRVFLSEIREVDTGDEPAAYVGASSFFERQSAQFESQSSQIPPLPKTYAFVLHGSAFLWHQVRHMVAILFLIGQGLESPTLVDRLLDVESNPRKPLYEMADESPLVLWDCIFPQQHDTSREDAMEWVYVGDEEGSSNSGSQASSSFKIRGKFGLGGLVDNTWRLWRQTKIDELLAGNLLNLCARQGNPLERDSGADMKKIKASRKVYLGGNEARSTGNYTPVMKRRTMDTVEEINQRYAVRKGFQGETHKMEYVRVNLDTRTDHRKD